MKYLWTNVIFYNFVIKLNIYKKKIIIDKVKFIIIFAFTKKVKLFNK